MQESFNEDLSQCLKNKENLEAELALSSVQVVNQESKLTECKSVKGIKGIARIVLRKGMEAYTQRRNARCSPLSMKLKAPKQLGPERGPLEIL